MFDQRERNRRYESWSQAHPEERLKIDFAYDVSRPAIKRAVMLSSVAFLGVAAVAELGFQNDKIAAISLSVGILGIAINYLQKKVGQWRNRRAREVRESLGIVNPEEARRMKVRLDLLRKMLEPLPDEDKDI